MGFLVENRHWSLKLCLNWLKMFGFLVPGKHEGLRKIFLRAYRIFWFAYLNGLYILSQAVDLLLIWGDLPLMVSTSFLLFTNVALGMKMINVVFRGGAIQTIIDEGDAELTAESRPQGIEIVDSCVRESSHQFYIYSLLSLVTVVGWAASAEKNELPLRAWYPYDTSKYPAYQITYFYQVTGLMFSAAVNVSMDTLATSMISVCRCRLRLIDYSLRNLCEDIAPMNYNELMSPDQDKLVMDRLKESVRRHQVALETAKEIQRCFSEPILAQFTVSMVIICVTAYQLAVELGESPKNFVRIVGMCAYLLCMIMQVFLYCNQGNQLTIESSELASAAYHSEWYRCSVKLRRSLVAVMTRSTRETVLTAGGLTTLSLACFTAIIKASYTFFTVLVKVEDRN